MRKPMLRNALTLTAAAALAACGGGNEGGDRAGLPASAAERTGKGAESSSAEQALVRFHVQGMTCAGCVLGTRAALRRLDGVADADASYDSASAWARYDPAKVTPERMIAAIRELGYTATVAGR